MMEDVTRIRLDSTREGDYDISVCVRDERVMLTQNFNGSGRASLLRPSQAKAIAEALAAAVAQIPYEEVSCDCDCGLVCPQGKIGMSPRCTIYKRVA
jgi:hypothetical protein